MADGACFDPNCPAVLLHHYHDGLSADLIRRAAEKALAAPYLTSDGRHPDDVRAEREPCPVYSHGADGWHCAVTGDHDQHTNAAGTETW